MSIVGSQGVAPIASGEDGLRELGSDALRPRASSPIDSKIRIANDDAQLARGAEPVAEETNDARDILNDDKARTNLSSEEMDMLDPSGADTVVTRATPTRRVGIVSTGSTRDGAVKVSGTPPRRRAASVFGTLGREIVTHPVPIIARSPALGVEPFVEAEAEEPETALEDDAGTEIQERETNENKALDADRDPNDDAEEENSARRRIYIRFKELSKETSAAYVHVLMGLFEDYPGDDLVMLVFDGQKERIEITAPNGVDYDQVSEPVQNIVGEDAVLEVLE